MKQLNQWYSVPQISRSDHQSQDIRFKIVNVLLRYNKSVPKLSRFVHISAFKILTKILLTRSSTRVLLNYSNKYKSLHKLAKKTLTVLVTSFAVERIFSQNGFIFRQYRAKMSRKTLQMLTILKCNKQLI